MSLLSPPLAWEGALRLVTERQLQKAAVQLMTAVGWRVFIDRVAYRSDPGWLDVYGLHVGMKRVVYLEFKTERGRVSPAQEEWIAAHDAVGNEATVIRPSDWERFVRLVVPPAMLPGGG